MRLALLAIPAVRSALSLDLGWEIVYESSIPSTQDVARDLAGKGWEHVVVVADEQSAGQGTKGRRWVAPKGTSLLASWVFRPIGGEPTLFALLAGVAVARALERVGVPEARLKWPNDVELDRKKVAGVLAHATTDGEASSIVLGIGVNVHQRGEQLPPELAATATSCAIAGHDVDRLALLGALARELHRIADPGERGAALDEWRRRATMLGREVEVTQDGQPRLRGIARDVADDGALIVGGERIVAGEVREVG